jgi:uncharacterized protein (TIGR03083 family)
MVPERDVDCGAIYEDARQELLALLRSLTPQQLATVVPATPDWAVRDVLAHVVGINHDLNRLTFGTRGDESWTAVHVETRRDHGIEDMAAEWDREAPQFEQGLRDLGYGVGSHFVGDLLHHYCDVTHALQLPRPSDELRLAVALDFYLSFFEEQLDEEKIGSVEVTVADEHWALGSGDQIAAVSAPRYEMFRSLGGRRSEEQIRALEWRGDVDAVLPVISRYPLPEQPIIEVG